MDDLSIRRPDLLNVLRLGTGALVEEDKGYGRITADDGEVLFVHFSEVVLDGFRALEEASECRSFGGEARSRTVATPPRRSVLSVSVSGTRREGVERDSGAGDW